MVENKLKIDWKIRGLTKDLVKDLGGIIHNVIPDENLRAILGRNGINLGIAPKANVVARNIRQFFNTSYIPEEILIYRGVNLMNIVTNVGVGLLDTICHPGSRIIRDVYLFADLDKYNQDIDKLVKEYTSKQERQINFYFRH